MQGRSTEARAAARAVLAWPSRSRRQARGTLDPFGGANGLTVSGWSMRMQTWFSSGRSIDDIVWGTNRIAIYCRMFDLEFQSRIYIYIYAQTGTFADPTVRCFKAFFDLCSFVRFFWCKVCTQAVHSAALWTRVTPQVWTCGKWKKCYGMDSFGTYFTHVQTSDVTRVQSAREWTASVHTLHMSKPVM